MRVILIDHERKSFYTEIPGLPFLYKRPVMIPPRAKVNADDGFHASTITYVLGGELDSGVTVYVTEDLAFLRPAWTEIVTARMRTEEQWQVMENELINFARRYDQRALWLEHLRREAHNAEDMTWSRTAVFSIVVQCAALERAIGVRP